MTKHGGPCCNVLEIYGDLVCVCDYVDRGRAEGIREERLACEQICLDTKTARGDLTDAAWAIRQRGTAPPPPAATCTWSNTFGPCRDGACPVHASKPAAERK
jgi:hypothetical protein